MFLVVLASAGMTGCEHIGPRTILDDRVTYNDAIANSWKQQTLLNIVRLRYMDTPEFVDVASIVGGYEHSHSVNGSFGADFAPNDTVRYLLAPAIGGNRTVVDRPTISYTPQTGSAFTRNLTNPIPPVSILYLIESGNPADVVMDLAVESINGIRNRGFAGTMQQADPKFQQVVDLIKRAQSSGQVSLRIVPGTEKDYPDVVLGIRDAEIDPAAAAELDLLRELLRLDPDVREFRVVFGMLPAAKDEIAIRTRSVIRILAFLALNVQVPPGHLADGRAPDVGDTSAPTQPQLTVFSGCEPPCDAFAAIQYQGCWFWVDPRDFHSKRTFVYLKILLALADTEQKDAAPALTIRAN